MKHLSTLLVLSVYMLSVAGTILALEQVIGHPARYVEQAQDLANS